MHRFLLLISTPPPGLPFFLVPASVLLFSFGLFSWLAELTETGASPLVLAVVTTIAANAGRNLPGEFERLAAEPSVRITVVAAARAAA